jgi:hypothetical protein
LGIGEHKIPGGVERKRDQETTKEVQEREVRQRERGIRGREEVIGG